MMVLGKLKGESSMEQQTRQVISIKCNNKKCPMPKSEFMKFVDDRNKLCSFCRYELEKKLAKLQNREPITLA
jgi:hypothetical protein